MKVYIETLGCDKNTVDSENAAGLIESGGHRVTKSIEDAGCILVNTCGFIEDAKRQSIEMIFDMARKVNESSPKKKLVVTGCLVQRYGEELKKEIPEIDLFLGVNDYPRLPNLLTSLEKENLSEKLFISKEKREYEEVGKRLYGLSSEGEGFGPGNNFSSFIKIAEGCDKMCSYCAIPLIRGHYRSRTPENILNEAKKAALSGCKELIVIAEDTACYGRDLKIKDGLAMILKELCKIGGIEWIRLLYCYEEGITQSLIDVIRDEPKICKYIDIPLQHINGSVLKAMNRLSSPERIRGIIENLRTEIPEIAIRTTLMTGFPGEGKEEFNELCDFVKETRFDRLGVFCYSKEDSTPASLLKPQIRKDEKERRRGKLMEIQRKISLEKNTKRVGTLMEVLTERALKDGVYEGRTRFDAPEIDNAVIFSSDEKIEPGSIVNVRITDAFDYDLSGEVGKNNESSK